MHQKQLTEHYYQILNEGILDLLGRGYRAGRSGLRTGGRAVGRGIDLLGTGIEAISPLLPYAAAGAGAYYGADLLKGLLGAVQPVSGKGRNFQGGSRRVVDANVARGLASGNKEDYYDYLADLQNSDMSATERSGSIIRTRALAANMARDRAAKMKAFALSDKTEEGKAYLAAKAEFDALKDDEVDAEPLTGTRPDGTKFSVGGKKMGKGKKAAYDKMQAARKAALSKEHTVGDLEGKRPSNAAATANTPSNSGNPPRTEDPNDLDSPEDYEEFDKQEQRRKEGEEHRKGERKAWAESFKNYYYNLLREQDSSGGIGQVPGAAEGQPRVDEINKDAEKKRKEAEEQAKKEEEQAKKEAEEAENARLSSSAGSAAEQMRIAGSLESGPMNLQPVERTRGGFSVGRGFGGKPIITGGSYKNPNSAEARVRADVDAGKLPASFGQYQGNRLPMDLEAEQKAAGDEAAQQIRDKVRSNIKTRNAKVEQELRDEDIQKNGPIPVNPLGDNEPGWEIRRAENIRKTPEYKDAVAEIQANNSIKSNIKDIISGKIKSKSTKKPQVSTQEDRDAIKSKITDEWLDTMRKASKI